MITAGYETSASLMSWGLYLMAKKPEIQNRLFEEASAVLTDHPSIEEVNELVYLDQFVFTPGVVAFFFGSMTLLEGKGFGDAAERIQDVSTIS